MNPIFYPIIRANIDIIAEDNLQKHERIGGGGFGTVYRATWQRDGKPARTVAKKELNDNAVNRAQDVIREALSMSKLSHKNVVPLYGVSSANSLRSLVIEYLPRGSLYDLLNSIVYLDDQQRKELGIGIASGLAYIHSKNMVHEDISSKNILLDDNGIPKIADFGLAKLQTNRVVPQTRSTSAGVGNPPWMAPELFFGRSHTKASDTYAFAVVLWEIEVARSPFSDFMDPLSESEILQLVYGIAFNRENLNPIPKETPQKVQDVIRKCWRTDRETRPEMRDVLRDLLKEGVGPALPPERIGHAGTVYSVALSSDGKIGLSGSDDKTVKVWDLTSVPEVRSMTGHAGAVYSVALSSDGKIGLSGSDDKTVKMLDLTSGTEIRSMAGHAGTVYSVALSSDGKIGLSGSDDKTVKMWDLTSGTGVKSMAGHAGTVYSVALSSDGRVGLSGSRDRTIKVLDLALGREVLSMGAHTDWVRSVVLSPDGKIGLSGSDDKTVKMWDLTSGTEIRSMTGHTDYVRSVALSSNGRVGLSGSYDETVKVWDLTSGRDVKSITGHADSVNGVAISSDGRVGLSGSRDKAVKIWDLSLRFNLQG